MLSIDLLPEGMFQLFRPVETWKRWENLKWRLEHPEKEKLNWGYKALDKITEIDFNVDHAARQELLYETIEAGELCANNEDAFRKILDITNKKNIPFYVYKSVVAYDNMDPVVRGCLRIQEIMKEYNNAHWIGDWNLYVKEMSINDNDFFDEAHMNRKGSVKNTFFMIKELQDLFGIEASIDNVFGYKSESIVKCSNNMYRYSMVNILPETKYSFILYEDGENILETEFSSNNYVDLPELINENQSLTCIMIPPDCNESDYMDVAEKGMRVSFMKELDTNRAIVFKE